MAKHEIVIHENLGATKAFAPYLGSYVSKETVREAAFALAASQKAGMSPIQFRAILDGSLQAIMELERSGLVRVNTDLGVIHAVITGSFPTADAAPDPDKNRLNLCLRLDDSIRLALADTVPTIIADESLTKLRVDNVMDLRTPRPYNLLHGQGLFRVAGFNMELSDEGAAVCLQDGKGVTYEVVVDEVVSKQLFIGHTAALLEPGDYKLVVKSRAGDAGGPLQTAFRRVKYLKVVEPLAESKDGTVKIMGVEEIAPDAPFAASGVNLGYDSGADRGIMGAVAEVGGKTVDWYCGNEEEGSANQSFIPSAPFPEDIPSGTYRVAVTFNLAGHGEELEPLVVQGVKIVVP